jgi:hypothetical protein
MLSILSIAPINNGSFKTQIRSIKDSLNDLDYQTIQQILSTNSIQKDGTTILASDQIQNVVQALENSGSYFVETFDEKTNVHQLTPTNWAQGKQPQLRQ